MKNVEDVYPLTPLQQGMLFHALQGPAGGVYVERLSCILRGDLDLAAFRHAWSAVLARHPILRTAFFWEDVEEPLQIVRTQVALPWHEEDWRHLSGVEQAEKLSAFLCRDLERGFVLEKAPLMRLSLFRLDERSWRLVWSHHHLVLDGWARVLVLRDVFQLYEASRRGVSPELPTVQPFRDYVAWLQQQDLAEAEGFWRRELAGFIAPTSLSMARTESAAAQPDGEPGERGLSLSARLTEGLQELARRERLTLNTLLQGAWALLLSRSSGEPDVVFGTVVSGRPAELAGVESMVGLFINTLPVRVRLSPDAAVMPWLRLLQENQAAQRCYEFSPLVRIHGWSEIPRSTPLFESLFVFENHPASVSQQGTGDALAVEDRRYDSRTHYPLTLIAAPGARLELRIQVRRDRFDDCATERLLEHLETLLQGFLQEGLRTLADLPLLTAPERHQLTVEWNDTERGFPAGATLHGLFEAQVERSPGAMALVWRGESLTYRELDERANRLAHALRARGVGPEVIVGIFAERTPALVVSLLAILKAGGAYLPLGLENPEERLAGLVEEAAAPVLLTQERLLPRLSWYRGTALLLDREDISDQPATSPADDVSAGNLAYVIYTSGSTGRPKGVAIEHRSAVTLVRWAAEVFPQEDLAGVLASTAIYFDLSVFELFVTLSRGGKVFLVENVLELASFDGGGELTLNNTVPSGIAELLRLEALPASVRTVNLAGEPLKSRLVRQLYALGSVRQVLNLYGPSEDTTYSTFARIDRDDDFPPIGSPVAGTQVRLLDRWFLPVPLGCMGEICLGGDGLARGYLGQPALTAVRFVPDPFSDRPGARLYRTGDLARYRSSGALEYLGRIDHQVKLRGFRIELGEIEAALQRHAKVREVVVMVRRDREDDPRLVAYVVPEPPEALASRHALAQELRRHLQDRLPAYMIPSALVVLESFPLTPNGKVDRKALPAPGRGERGGSPAAPRTPMEEVLAGVWSEVLGLERIGAGEDFFALGGHSLLAVQVLARIRHLFSVDLPLRAFFEEPTLAGLAAQVEKVRGRAGGLPELPPLARIAHDPATPLSLSFAQQRLWFIQQLEPRSVLYNLPAALRLSGPVRVEALAGALREIVRRHESLRTTFEAAQGVPFQRVRRAAGCPLPVVDLAALPPAVREEEARRLAEAEARHPFNLEHGPVLRTRLLRLGTEDHALLLTVHHIASDGWSMGVLTRDLVALYRAACAGAPSPLPELPIQYADFAAWQRHWLHGEALNADLTFWSARLAGADPRLELPTDRPRPALRSLRGAHQKFNLPADLSAAVAALGQREGTTLFMTALAAFQALLARVTGQTDLSVGSPTAGRNRLELEGLIGFFVNTLVLRADLQGNPSFREILAQARDTVLDAVRHQNIPFEKLVEELELERDLSRTPLFQAMLVLQSAPQGILEAPGLTFRPIEVDSGTAKFDLTFFLSGGAGGLGGSIEYCADLYDAATVLRLADQLRNLLAGAVADPARRLADLLVLSDAERDEILAQRSRTHTVPKTAPAAGAQSGRPASPGHQAPRSFLEERIAGIWKELLDLDRIGVHDRLFDLGAHSLLMVRAFVQLRELVGDRLTLVDLFKYPTIASLVAHLESAPGRETLKLQRGRERSESRSAAQGQGARDVAIVGLRGRFPRARDLGQFWQNLCDGVEAVSFFSDDELRRRGVDPALLNDPNYVKAGYVLEDFEWFDASFFGYSPREAEVMDPQQRLFLECAWEALEDAGYDPHRYPEAVGVFAGVSMSWYWMNLFSNPDLLAVQGTYQAMIGNDKDFLPTRVSYKLNLRGPSCNVQSACSTSLVAVHLACQSLLNGECDMALAGGVSASAQQGTGYTYTEGGIFSPDGHCRAFDARAQGTVAGSGLAVVVLKRLEDALADGDCIRAVIKGSAVNNDGSFKVGYSAPSVEGQANVIAEAQAVAGIDPETVTYVETHGTGTEVGDPIELEALTAAWRQRTARKGFCALGSVKTNVGHLDAAAGVTGLVKTVLALEAGKIPPTLHFERPNPGIDLENSPFYINDRLIEWTSEGPRRAGVSSFGLGGTNAHVVLEEAPPCELSGPSRPLQLLVLSTRANLEVATDRLADFLRREPATPLPDVAYTHQVGRAQLDHRRVLVCRDREDALRALEARDPQRLLTLNQEPISRRVVFLFPGGGAQYADMGLELYREEPVFREEVDRCLEILAPHLGLDLKPYLYPSLVAAAPGGPLSRTSTALPALFVTEIALAKLWMSWGVRPQALIGHSLGEYAAAYLAGVMSLEDALALVALRGRLFEKLPEGAMLSVPLPETEVLPLLDERLSIAAINDVTQCVVSGPVEEIARLERELTARGLEVHKLHIEVAAHSTLVEPILEEFGAFLRTLRLQAPEIPFVSDVTGTWIRDEEATDPGYWVRQLRHTVRFAAGLDTLFDLPHQVFLEMGPGRILSSFVRRHPRKTAGHEIFTTLRHINDSISDLEFTFNLLGRLWLIGQEIDWAGFYAGERRHRVPLPTYPFDRQRYWVERRPEAIAGALSRRGMTKKPDVADWFYVPSWRLSAWPAAEVAEVAGEPAAWLLFADEHGLGRELAGALAAQGHRVVTVAAGELFARLEPDAYVLDPASAAGHDALLADLHRRGGIPRRIVHLWSVTPDGPARERGFYSLLWLSQALLRQNVTDLVQLDAVASGLQRVDGGDAIDPEKATLLGVCQVLPQEHDHFSCRAIDVVLQSGNHRELAGRLLAEISRRAGDRLVAFRGRRRWVRSFDPVRIDAPVGAVPALRDRGVYLITGGLGRFGLSYARHLAGRVQARLVLIGRSGLPPREDWPEWLESRGNHAVSHKIRRVQELEASGAEVEVVSADVADEAQMRAVIERARRRFGGLHGVIHAAGLIGPETFRAISETGRREAEAHFRPKLGGAAVLARVLDGLDVDFCLMISSISTVLGGLGFAAYSAANLALDAFAQERDAAGGTAWMSVGWDAWAEREDEERGRSAVGAELAELAMAPEEGLDVLERCLSLLGVPQLFLSTGDLEARMRRWSRDSAEADSDTELAAGPSSLHDRPNLPHPYVAPRDERERAVAGLWQKLFGIQQIGVYDDFFELGGDSLRATQLAAGLRRLFQVNIPLRALFDAPTVAGQVEVIAGLQAAAPAERTLDETPALAPIQSRRRTLLDELEDLELLPEEELESAWMGGEMSMSGGLE
jgi:amino acid adenylation domain-containing protein